jgi:ubiquinone/menaquinone biosynthesis C-methylase UbiE
MGYIIKKLIRLLGINSNQSARQLWLKQTISSLKPGLRILDAGAGELRNKPLCDHLKYVSQDVCQYKGTGNNEGLQTGTWNTDGIDLICDITKISEPDSSFDIILCSEVFEHLPDPLKALDEFSRLLKPGGHLIVTAPFSSLVHFAPYHFATGFSRYWYEHHLPLRGFQIDELTANGDWFAVLKQELIRLPRVASDYHITLRPFSYILAGLGFIYFLLPRNENKSYELSCFGWHILASKCGLKNG